MYKACSLRLWAGNATPCCMPASWQLRFASSSRLKAARSRISDNAGLVRTQSARPPQQGNDPTLEPDLPTTSALFYYLYFPSTRNICGHRASHYSLTMDSECVSACSLRRSTLVPLSAYGVNPSLPPSSPVSGRYGCHMPFNLNQCHPRLYGVRSLN